jgi:hypothetical protein
MSRLLLSLLLASLVSFTTLSADMKGMKHNTQMPASCKMHTDTKCDYAMKKTEGEMSSHCKMMSEKPACDCKNGSACTCKASGKECKCGAKSDVKAAKCGCGMTIESCKEMMPSCKYRDAREAKEAKK